MTLLQTVKIQYYNVVQNVFMTRTIERYPIYLFKYYLTVHAYFNTYMNLNYIRRYAYIQLPYNWYWK